MGLLELASNNSFWKGLDYYEENRAINVNQVSNFEYTSEVKGREAEPYQVLINIKKPRTSQCTCPFAKDRRVICKHMVATYLTIFPEEGERIKKEAEEYEAENEKRWEEECKEIEKHIYSLTKAQLRNELYHYMMAEKERQYW